MLRLQIIFCLPEREQRKAILNYHFYMNHKRESQNIFIK